MARLDHLLDEFADAISTARDVADLQAIGSRVGKKLGFRWFAYLNRFQNGTLIVSSYPRDWTRHYVESGYEHIDPIVQRSRCARKVFDWDGNSKGGAISREQRRFFAEATSFGIRCGMTAPIRGGFGRSVAFTLAHDEPLTRSASPPGELAEALQLIGVYFHARAVAGLDQRQGSEAPDSLSQRERQCLAWIACGKTVTEIAVLVGISARTVSFHLENARQKLGAASIAQCVAEAIRRGHLS